MTTTEAPPTERLLVLAREQARQAAARRDRVASDHAQRAAQAQAKIDAERAAKAQEAARQRAKEEQEQRQLTDAEQAAQEAADEVARLERLAVLEAAEAAAADLAGQAALALANRPADTDLSARAEQWSEQVLGVAIPAALWKVQGYGGGFAAQTTFLGGAWTFFDVEGPELILDGIQADGGDPIPTHIVTLADLGDLLAFYPHSLSVTAPAGVGEHDQADDDEGAEDDG
ncbi:MAG TPA: hypothetical protein VK975_00120 [Acidimicrobiales bacterium]|nr:hypothetical protein [Acidimicrobiales bacterium]